MNLDAILLELKEFLTSSLPLLGVFSCLTFAFYQYKLKKKVPFFKIFSWFAFFLNFILIIYLTFLTRTEITGTPDFHLFRSYREAWNSFSIRNWQLVIFNIIVFLPLGTLLPIIVTRLRKAYKVVGLGFFFSLFIELTQKFTHKGLCELDDLFNNTLGVLLGYCIFRLLYALTHEQKNRSFCIVFSLLPLCLTFSCFGSIFYQYYHQDYGNLQIDYTYPSDLSKTKLALVPSLKLSKKGKKVPIYKPKGYSKKEALAFEKSFFQKIQVDDKEVSTKFTENSLTSSNGKHQISIDLKNRSYCYYNLKASGKKKQEDYPNLREYLKSLGIEIPKDIVYTHPENGHYIFTIPRSLSSMKSISGSLECITSKEEILSINNQWISQSIVNKEDILSEQQAYERLAKGYFQIDRDLKLKSIQVYDVALTYSLDTKDYYQPVYLFYCKINEKNYDLVIPALKKARKFPLLP